MMTPAARMEARFADAVEAVAASFPSKAAQKAALDKLNRAYTAARDVVRDLIIDDANARWPNHCDERTAHFDRWDMPFDLHQVRDKHVIVATYWDLRAANIITALAALRAEVKAAPVVKVEKADAALTEKAEQVQRSIRDEMERLGKMYAHALEVGRLFNNLPVTANVHMVTNQFGTRFLRAFYYLDGKRMPLNLIIAAAQQLADEASA
jgi:hypothetical protein